jgi:hypothetical protein
MQIGEQSSSKNYVESLVNNKYRICAPITGNSSELKNAELSLWRQCKSGGGA